MKKVSQKTAEPEQWGVADAVPAETAPKPPTTYVARVLGRGPIGYRPQRAQRQVALKAAKELSTSTQYAARFGQTAPAQVLRVPLGIGGARSDDAAGEEGGEDGDVDAGFDDRGGGG